MSSVQVRNLKIRWRTTIAPRRLPALVNGHCAVLKGQARRANGALYYRNYDEFARGLSVLLARRDLTRRLGAQGLAYVEREYRWPTVVARIDDLLARTVARRTG